MSSLSECGQFPPALGMQACDHCGPDLAVLVGDLLTSRWNATWWSGPWAENWEASIMFPEASLKLSFPSLVTSGKSLCLDQWIPALTALWNHTDMGFQL